MALSKDIVQKYIDSALKSEVLEESFAPFAKEHKPNNGMQRILLNTITTSSEPDKIIKHYVNLMAQVKSPTKFDVLFDILRTLVQQHPNLGKAVCEALLSCDYLDYHNQNQWMRSFALISEILPNVDYKGVRDILKLVLEIVYFLPERFDIAIIPQLDTLYSTFSMILDRKACLLPAYLSLDELQKKVAQGHAPIWKFAELFYHFIESFCPTAQIFSIINRPELFPVVGFSSFHTNPSWRLDPISAKFQLKGLLPYKNKLKEPQVGQVRYLLEQPHSREMIFHTLGAATKSTNRCSELIEQIATSLVHAMEQSELDLSGYSKPTAADNEHIFQWLHLSSNLLFYILYSQASISFNHLIDSLCERIKAKDLKRGREHLMWAMLQYITGPTKSTLADFLHVIKLFDLLYPSRTPIPLPDENSCLSTHALAAASIWFQLIKRAELEQVKFFTPLPPALRLHYEYIIDTKRFSEPVNRVDYQDAILLNAHASIKNSYPVTNFIDCLCLVDPVNNPNPAQAAPLPMTLLDSLTTHGRIALLHATAQRIMSLAQQEPGTKSAYILTSALIETYGRLLVYTDTESYGLKSFINSLMSGPVCRLQAWHIYHVLLEMYNYRIHHVYTQYKISMLSHLHNLTPAVYSANQMQLSMTMEATELKLLLGLSNQEALNMPVTNTRQTSESKTRQLINLDSEELNKVLVLVLARSTHITASENVMAAYLEDILNDINKVTPLTWTSSTLNFFPEPIKEFFIKNGAGKEADRALLRPAVEEEYRKWKAMADENTLVARFTQPNAPPLFICILWKMLLDGEFISPAVYRILDNTRIRSLSAHLRTFVDYLVFEFANTVGGQHVNKYAEALNDLMWKYQIISLDRLLLCMCLRSFEGCEGQVCFFIIQLLLLKIPDFKSIAQEFCRVQSPDHWRPEVNYYQVNCEFQRKHPEKYYHDFLAEHNIPSTSQTLPSYYSNIVLRFIPVFDILLHRALELRISTPNSTFKLDALLDEFSCVYKFHDKPLTYLYNTLHYYDSLLPAPVKRKLTASIVGACDSYRPPNWCLSESCTQYLKKVASTPSNQPAEEWVPNQEYYKKLIGRLVDTLQNKNSFYHTDWRFNEFLNAKAHAVHATAIELMTLPLPPNVVANSILDLILTNYVNQDRATISQWMNAIGLVVTALPPSYYSALNSRILESMRSPLLTNPAYTAHILQLTDFSDSHERMYESQISYLVALTHAIWHHSSAGQIFSLPAFWKKEIKEAVETESQFLFICCLIGPFLPRLERSRSMMDVVVDLYEMLGKVDASVEIQHLNTISDFFYHIKYMFTGDAVKTEIERCIRNFKPKLQYCLRFITHLNINNELQNQKSD